MAPTNEFFVPELSMRCPLVKLQQGTKGVDPCNFSEVSK